jgi:phosphatidylserine decarboxylase
MDRLFRVPRKAALQAFGERFGAESRADKQRREKSETRLREGSRTEAAVRRSLIVRVGSGRNLASKDANGLSDPLLEVTLLDQQQRTKVIKKTLSPHWNEVLEFDLTGLDDIMDELTIICWDWNNTGLFANDRKNLTYMGELRLLLKDLPNDPRERWWPLVTSTSDFVSGEIELAFTRKEEPSSSSPRSSSASDSVTSAGSTIKTSTKGSKESKDSTNNKELSKEERERIEKQKVIAESLQQVFGI